MSIAYLDINDSNLQLWNADKRLQSPGYALLEGREYRFGSTARAAARLRPRDVSTRYWWQLSTDPLQPALGPARHSADLVHAHLQALHKEAGEPGELLLAVPGSMHKEQLALLLGIIQQCPFSAVGLVNRSVALASLYRADGPLFHLEVQLHQALLTELRTDQGEVALQRTVALSGCGLLQLQERLVTTVAAAFIRQTRFDPRRRAETEQQLYDALPAALRQLQRSPEASITVQGYHARITRTDLQSASEALCSSVSASVAEQGAGGQLLLDPVVALLPGLQQQLPGILLDADALPRVLAAHEQQLVQREEALAFVNRLPQLGEQTVPVVVSTNGTATTEPAAPTAPGTVAPTHLLRDHRAEALRADGIDLGGGWQLVAATEGWCLRGTGNGKLTRNGKPCRDGEAVASGDWLGLADNSEARLITVSG